MTYFKYCDFVLFIDSGIGGLSLYFKIKDLLPDINYIYLFDNAAFPYGEKDEDFIVKRIIDIITKIYQKYNLIMVILACNTASIVSLSVIKSLFPFVIIGIKPAIKLATKITRNGVIGLLATRATINANYTKKIINRFINFYNIKNIIASDLVLLAEKKFLGQLISENLIFSVVNDWIYGYDRPDTIILGCTHFTFLLKELKSVFSKNTIFVDYNFLIAKKVVFLLGKRIFLLKNSKNIIYCTKLDLNVKKLFLILKKFDFNHFKKINI